MTNYERIKSMSIEELAATLYFSKCQNFCIYANTDDCVERDRSLRNCRVGTIKWLKSEVQEMSDKNFNEWLFADIDDLIDCDYSDESEAETE